MHPNFHLRNDNRFATAPSSTTHYSRSLLHNLKSFTLSSTPSSSHLRPATDKVYHQKRISTFDEEKEDLIVVVERLKGT
jgi:hypothetical protein